MQVQVQTLPPAVSERSAAAATAVQVAPTAASAPHTRTGGEALSPEAAPAIQRTTRSLLAQCHGQLFDPRTRLRERSFEMFENYQVVHQSSSRMPHSGTSKIRLSSVNAQSTTRCGLLWSLPHTTCCRRSYGRGIPFVGAQAGVVSHVLELVTPRDNGCVTRESLRGPLLPLLMRCRAGGEGARDLRHAQVLESQP